MGLTGRPLHRHTDLARAPKSVPPRGGSSSVSPGSLVAWVLARHLRLEVPPAGETTLASLGLGPRERLRISLDVERATDCDLPLGALVRAVTVDDLRRALVRRG